MSTRCLRGGHEVIQRGAGRSRRAHCRGMCYQGTSTLPGHSPKLDWVWGMLTQPGCSSGVYVGWLPLPCFSQSLAFVSRWWWLCTARDNAWAEHRSRETQILPQVRRVHSSALSTALESPLGFARSSMQHNYQIVSPN